MAGCIYAPAEGVYTFECLDDGGSRLGIGHGVGSQVEVVENGGSHSTRSQRGRIAFARGWHPISIGYFEDFAGSALRVSWAGPGTEKVEFDPASLAHHRNGSLSEAAPAWR